MTQPALSIDFHAAADGANTDLNAVDSAIRTIAALFLQAQGPDEPSAHPEEQPQYPPGQQHPFKTHLFSSLYLNIEAHDNVRRLQLLTPFTDPNGDPISVYHRVTDSGPVLSDSGDTFRVLAHDPADRDRAAQVAHTIQTQAQAHGISYEASSAALFLAYDQIELALAFTSLIQAILASYTTAPPPAY